MEKEIKLKAYRSEIEVLHLTLDVPSNKGKEDFLYSYEDVLLKVFNNKRENKDILEINNYFGSNEITIVINLTHYMEDNHSSKEEAIEHLKDWFSAGLDVSNDQIEEYLDHGYLYSVPTYLNDVDGISNYIDWED